MDGQSFLLNEIGVSKDEVDECISSHIKAALYWMHDNDWVDVPRFDCPFCSKFKCSDCTVLDECVIYRSLIGEPVQANLYALDVLDEMRNFLCQKK